MLFLHIAVSCKDNLDYSHLVLRINLDSFNAGLAAVLSQLPDLKPLEIFTLATYFHTALLHDFRINMNTKEKITSESLDTFCRCQKSTEEL